MLYYCNRQKSCRHRFDCGRGCYLTNDSDYAFIPTKPTKIECATVGELNFMQDLLRDTDLNYRVDGFNIILLPY